MGDRRGWIVADYQKALAARGAKVTGRKWELEERLEAYERNDNFGAQPLLLGDDPLPHFPDITKFRYKLLEYFPQNLMIGLYRNGNEQAMARVSSQIHMFFFIWACV